MIYKLIRDPQAHRVYEVKMQDVPGRVLQIRNLTGMIVFVSIGGSYRDGQTVAANAYELADHHAIIPPLGAMDVRVPEWALSVFLIPSDLIKISTSLTPEIIVRDRIEQAASPIFVATLGVS